MTVAMIGYRAFKILLRKAKNIVFYSVVYSVFFFVFSASSTPDRPVSIGESSSIVSDAKIRVYRQFTFYQGTTHAAKINPTGMCAEVLRETQDRLGRELNTAEIGDILEQILPITGESLISD